jgi:hypothetical protein
MDGSRKSQPSVLAASQNFMPSQVTLAQELKRLV